MVVVNQLVVQVNTRGNFMEWIMILLCVLYVTNQRNAQKIRGVVEKWAALYRVNQSISSRSSFLYTWLYGVRTIFSRICVINVQIGIELVEHTWLLYKFGNVVHCKIIFFHSITLWAIWIPKLVFLYLQNPANQQPHF